jgi:hypothetical protein
MTIIATDIFDFYNKRKHNIFVDPAFYIRVYKYVSYVKKNKEQKEFFMSLSADILIEALRKQGVDVVVRPVQVEPVQQQHQQQQPVQKSRGEASISSGKVYKEQRDRRIMSGDRKAIIAQDREDMRGFVKNRKKNLLSALARAQGPEEIAAVRDQLANIVVGPTNTVLWPKVQQLLLNCQNPKLTDDEREFHAKRYEIFMKKRPDIPNPVDELNVDRERMHNMYKERKKTLFRMLERESNPDAIVRLQESIRDIRKEPVRPSNVKLWGVVQDLYKKAYDITASPEDRAHAARRYAVYMKTPPVQHVSSSSSSNPAAGSSRFHDFTDDFSEPLVRHYTSKKN